MRTIISDLEMGVHTIAFPGTEHEEFAIMRYNHNRRRGKRTCQKTTPALSFRVGASCETLIALEKSATLRHRDVS